jgi:death on curing protein
VALLFLRTYEVLAIQTRAIEEFGGLHGVRDVGALEAALTAVENRAYYEQVSLPVCAATYAYHLTQAHAFLDGNKRLAAAVAEIFLELNGAALQTTDEEIVAVFLAIAAGEVSRQDVEQWFAQWVVFKQEPSA